MLPSTSVTPESLLIEHSGNDAVRCAIEQLPVIFREVILLCDVEDASYQEIAEMLSIPIGTVMSRLARGRKAVRESLRCTPGAPLSRDLSHHIETHEKGTGAAETAQRAGAMREVSIDQDFAAEKDKLPLDFSDWRSNPEDLYNASELQQEQCRPAARKSRGPACEWSSSCETYSRLPGADVKSMTRRF